MSTENKEGEETQDPCQIIDNVMEQKKMEKCSPKQLIENLADRLGIEVEIENPEEPDPDCPSSLEEGLDEETCENMNGLRQWVFCRAWELVDKEGFRLGEAESKAWSEAKKGCMEHDIEI